MAAERRRSEEALTAERGRSEEALAAALAAERRRSEEALTAERRNRSLVAVHLADRGLPLKRVLLLFTIPRSGSTWLFDMLRTHPAVRIEPTARVWTALGMHGSRYPVAFHHSDRAVVPIEVATGVGAVIPAFPHADLTKADSIEEAERWALEKGHPQFVSFEADRFAARIRGLRESGVEVEIVYGVRCPLDAMWSMVEYKSRDPEWLNTLPIPEIPQYIARSLEVQVELRGLFGGAVIEYESLPDSAMLKRLGCRLAPAWGESEAKAWLAHAAFVTERSMRSQRTNAGFFGLPTRSHEQAGPDGVWRDAVGAIAAARAAHRCLTAREPETQT